MPYLSPSEPALSPSLIHPSCVDEDASSFLRFEDKRLSSPEQSNLCETLRLGSGGLRTSSPRLLSRVFGCIESNTDAVDFDFRLPGFFSHFLFLQNRSPFEIVFGQRGDF